MRFGTSFITSVFALLALVSAACAQTPREELDLMVKELQDKSYDQDLREKTIRQAQTLKHAPEIPEEARRSFIIGEALFRQAKSLKPAYEAANAFWMATTLAPWWSDAYWNLAAAQQLAGQYASAKNSLKFYLLTNPSAADKRIAQDRIYAIEADIIAAKSGGTAGLAGFWQRSSYKRIDTGEWVNDDPDNVRRRVYEIQQAGSSLGVKCLSCDSDSNSKWTFSVVSSAVDAITFNQRLKSPWYDSGLVSLECNMDGTQLACTTTQKDTKGNDEKFTERYSKHNICEIVGGPGIQGYFVICK